MSDRDGVIPTSRPFSVTAVIPAPADVLYDIVADYREGHPRILPNPPFRSLEVVEGGRGEGTVIRVEVRFFGRTQTFRASVREPVPGRVLEETTDTGFVTRFAFEPLDGGDRTRATIETVLVGRRGFRRWLEPALMRRLLEPVYRTELGLLEQVARGASRP